MKTVQPYSQLASSGTTTPFIKSANSLQDTVAPPNNLLFGRFIPVYEIADGMNSIDEVIAELETDTVFSDALKDSATWVADTFYPGETSLRTLRLRAGLSQRQLAELIGTKQPHIFRMENGGEDVRMSTIKRLAVALNVSASQLFEIMSSQPHE